MRAFQSRLLPRILTPGQLIVPVFPNSKTTKFTNHPLTAAEGLALLLPCSAPPPSHSCIFRRFHSIMAATSSLSAELQMAEDFWQRYNGPPREFKLWSPPEDPDEPRLPYIPSFTVQIRRHVPPLPFGGPQYGSGTREWLSQDYLRGVTQSELVIDHPSLETPLPARPEAAQLTITMPIAIGSIRGAQVVACTIVPQTEGGKPFQAVAKIYDPLYYSFDWSSNHQPRDTVRQAESDYSREAAAYEHLQNTEPSFAPA